jgi:2-dehydro-3-deoxygluconokinase
MKDSKQHKKIVSFGEVLMRLSPAENRKLPQAKTMDFYFGGTEMNVAASLAYFGEQTQQITNVSNDLVGDAAIAAMRQFGIDVSAVNKVDHPLGLYFSTQHLTVSFPLSHLLST